MACSRNLLYMFEFVIDDLMILKQNLCAPEEYPTCVEITFRSNVYINICDREFGTCVNPKQFKCGKCCIFSLDSPVTDKDRLYIHVFKKRTNRCKFLIGMTELPVKSFFDRVRESLDVENTNWEKYCSEQLQNLPKLKGPNTEPLDNCSCYEPGYGRVEQLCPTTESTKRLLPLFNLCKQQTGNIVITMHLICNGPSIVSMFKTNQTICSRNPKCPPPCCDPCGKPCKPKRCPSSPSCPPVPCCPEDPCDPCDPCRGAGGAASATGGPMDKGNKCCKGSCSPCPPCRQCVQPNPCYKAPPEQKKCLRYFACNLDKMCPTDYCEDEFDRECPTVPSQRCKSVIEQKLETCGPCRGVPAHPRYVQEQKQKDMEIDRKDKPAQDKEKSKKGRQQGGGLCASDDDMFCEHSQHNQCDGESADPCAHCCPAYASCCDLARNRAIRQLRHLLVKYNIQI